MSMTRDTTPDHLKLANDNFTTEKHEKVAEMLLEEWDEATSLNKLSEKYNGEDYPNHSKTVILQVYQRYMGVPEEEFGDGLEDPRTIEEIKQDHGKYIKYDQLRRAGGISEEDFREYLDEDELEEEETEQMVPLSKVFEMTQEGTSKGYDEGYERGYNQGFEAGYQNALRALGEWEMLEDYKQS